MLYSKIDGQGKPLVIIHGFLGMSDNWKTLAAQYVLEGFQTHAIDMRNHGKSFHSDDFDYEVMVEDVVNYCKINRLDLVDVIGHSMGGKIAMLLATSYPELVNKLIVADIGPKHYPPHHQAILAALNAVNFALKPSRADVEEVIAQYVVDFGTRQFLLKNLYWINPGQLAFRFNLAVFNRKIDAIGAALPFNNYFDKPTLFIRGGNSNYILDADFETISHHFPKATIETIPNVGHWLHAENSKDFFEKTLRILK
jgi:esterase